jgi:hypothetical protein
VNVVLPEAVWLEFKRDHYELKRQCKNLQSRLANVSLRRHQANYMPSQAFMFIGKADAEIASGASGTVSVWTGTAGAETDSEENRDGYNRTGLAIGSGNWCLGMRINNQWYLEPWECA